MVAVPLKERQETFPEVFFALAPCSPQCNTGPLSNSLHPLQTEQVPPPPPPQQPPGAPRQPSVLTCSSEAATHRSGAPRAFTGPGRASHRRGSAGAMSCCPGGEASGSASQRGALLFPSPRAFPESTPRPSPTLPHPGETGRGGPWPRRRRALSPPLGSAWRRGPGGHDSSTPVGRTAGAPRTHGRLEEAGGAGAGVGRWGSIRAPSPARGTPGGTRGTERYPGAHSPEVCARSALPSKIWRRTVSFLSRGEERRNTACAPPGGLEFSLAAPPDPECRLQAAGGARRHLRRSRRRGCNQSPRPRPPASPVAPGSHHPSSSLNPPAKKKKKVECFLFFSCPGLESLKGLGPDERFGEPRSTGWGK